MFTNKTGRSRFKAGFSLIELLLVLTLAPIVFFVVFSNFSMGTRLWQRLQTAVPEEDAVIFLLKLRPDFDRAMRYSPLPFGGEREEVSFVTGIEAPPELGGKRGIGQVRYFFSASARAILRETKDFSQLYREASGKTDRMLEHVHSFEAAYLTYNSNDSSFEWNSSYAPATPGDLPLAVKLIYRMEDASEDLEQTFFIPAGGTLK